MNKIKIILLFIVGFTIGVMSVLAEESEYYDDDESYAEDEVGQEYIDQIWDPWESINRPVAKFNDFILDPALKLVDLYEETVPQFIRKGIKSSLRNLNEPYYVANNALEGDVDGTLASIARMMVNTFAGFGGIIDVAGNNNCLPYTPQSLSTTLGTWGVPHGYYIVWPFLGPNTLRTSVSTTAESFSDVMPYLNNALFRNLRQRYENVISFSYQGIRVFDNLDSYKEAIRAGKESAFDFYVFSRSAFYQIEGGRTAKAKYPNFWGSEMCNDSARRNRLDEF